MKVKKQQLELDHNSKLGQYIQYSTSSTVCQSFILSSYLFNLYAEYIVRNVRLEEAQAEIYYCNEFNKTFKNGSYFFIS